MLDVSPVTVAAIDVMPADEADRLIGKVQIHLEQAEGHIESARALLYQLYIREGWRSLGYSSFRECAAAKFSRSYSTLYRQIQAAEIEQEVSPTGEIGGLPERSLRPLSRIEAGDRRSVFDAAAAAAAGGTPTPKEVEEAVDRHLADDSGDIPTDLPSLAELLALYAQIAERVEHRPTQKYRNQFAVERTAHPAFSASFLGRRQAWGAWRQKFYKMAERHPLAIEKRMETPGYPLSVRSDCKAGDRVRWSINGEEYTVVDLDFQGHCTLSGANSVIRVSTADLLKVEAEKQAEPEKRSRVANDYYPTPAGITQALKQKVRIAGQVFEPCAGHGAIAEHFDGCVTNEPFPCEEFRPDFQHDATDRGFWRWFDEEQGGCDWVVTNPPYEGDIMLPILQNSLEFARVGVAMLVRLSYLEPCQKRRDWFVENADRLRYLIPVSPRPKFRRDVDASDSITVAWMVWKKDFSWAALGLESPFQFIWDWKEEGNA